MNRINENYFEIIGLVLIGIFRVGIEIKDDGAFIRFVCSTRSKASRDIHISEVTNRLKVFYTDFSWRKIRRETA